MAQPWDIGPATTQRPHRRELTTLTPYAYWMRMKAREVVRLLEAEGWVEARMSGSHRHFKHPTRPGLVTVPVHGSTDLKIGVLKSIERQSGVEIRDK